MVDEEGELFEDEDDDGNPMYAFTLWEPAAINGRAWRVGGVQVAVIEPYITGRRPAWGGAFARMLYPAVVEESGKLGPEPWGWGPPPLVHEGRLVQPDWLYDYLLDPTAIRPAAVLKMPKHTLSPEEAGKLVDYFAAVAGTDFPYAPRSGGRLSERLAPEEMERFDRAMRILLDRKTYCAKCHLVGDFGPGGEDRTVLAPNLAEVGRRIRPEYLHRWLADPKSVLPYTAMPVNFPPPPNAPMGQDLYPGTSVEQLEAVLDLLKNFDRYVQQRTSIRGFAEGDEAND